jgi:hypothetical protein
MGDDAHPGPWRWDSNCGEWGLWDAAGKPLIMEYTFSDPRPRAQLDPYVEAVTAAAPNMLALLRDWLSRNACFYGSWPRPPGCGNEDCLSCQTDQFLRRIDEAGK